MLDKQFYVYVHMKSTDDSVFYVGKGCKNRYKKKQGRNQYWQRIVAKYGFVAEIVKSNLTFEEANAYEIELIKQLRESGCQLCNLTDGGEGCRGRKFTEDAKLMISQKTRGKKRSEASRKKMMGNQNALGAKRSEEVRAKISAAKKGNNHIAGRPVSEETRKKISESRKKTEEAKRQAKSLIDSMQKSKGVSHA